MINLKIVPGVKSLDLYQIYGLKNTEGAVCERLAIFFAAPWSLPCQKWAELIGAMKKELNSQPGNRNFL